MSPNAETVLDEERRTAMLARLDQLTEWPLTLLAVALIPILLAQYVFSVGASTRSRLDQLDYLIWGIFAAELAVKLTVTPHRTRFLRDRWIDVVLVAVPMLRPLRLARTARALRLLRTGRSGVALLRFIIGGRRILSRHGLHYVLAVALVVVIMAAWLVTAAERSVNGATITNLPDGLWWAVTTVTTVGYGDTYPQSAVGRGIGVMLMLLGISLFGVVTANVAAFFVEAKESELTTEIRELKEQICLLRESVLTSTHSPE